MRSLMELFRFLYQPISPLEDRKSTRLNSSHPSISYAVFCLKKKTRDLDRIVAHIRLHRGRNALECASRRNLPLFPSAHSVHLCRLCLRDAVYVSSPVNGLTS